VDDGLQDVGAILGGAFEREAWVRDVLGVGQLDDEARESIQLHWRGDAEWRPVCIPVSSWKSQAVSSLQVGSQGPGANAQKCAEGGAADGPQDGGEAEVHHARAYYDLATLPHHREGAEVAAAHPPPLLLVAEAACRLDIYQMFLHLRLRQLLEAL
jgi:hypothetical protein